MKHQVHGLDFKILKSWLLALYERSGGKRRKFLSKLFNVSDRDIAIALWLRRFLPEDFEALWRGEITMAEGREIYRKAKPEMEARGELIEEWRDLEKRIPEFSRISVLLGYLEPEIEDEMERLRARLSELSAELEEARAEAESFSRERDKLEEERKNLEEENKKLREDLREARKYIDKLVKSIDPHKKRAKKRFIDKITRHYERKLDKLREKNRELKELLVEAQTENARLKALLGGRALKVVPVKIACTFMVPTGILRNPEFRETVVG